MGNVHQFLKLLLGGDLVGDVDVVEVDEDADAGAKSDEAEE